MTQPPSARSERAVIALIADELRRNDDCGPGPLSEQEYLDDAAAILRIVQAHPKIAAGRDRYREALERVTEAYDDPKKMVDIAWEALEDQAPRSNPMPTEPPPGFAIYENERGS